MIDPHKPKYFPLYWQMAEAAAQQSVATRAQVGAIVVTPTGMISPGWNGMPAGMDNACEHPVMEVGSGGYSLPRMKTRPEVIHAEQNALDKMARQGIPTGGSLLFVTLSPCFACCKRLIGLGLAGVYYDHMHDETDGLDMLRRSGVPIRQRHTIPHPTENAT